MKSAEQIQLQLRAMLPGLRRRWPVLSLGIFGSYARGDAREDSDLDLLVAFDRPVAFSEYLALEDEISRLVGLRVELVTRDALKPRIGQRILTEVVPV